MHYVQAEFGHEIYAGIHKGINSGNIDLVKKDIRMGGVPNTLHLGSAIEKGHFDIALFLLPSVNPSRKAAVNPETGKNETPLALVGRLKQKESDPREKAQLETMERAIVDAVSTWPARQPKLAKLLERAGRVLGINRTP